MSLQLPVLDDTDFEQLVDLCLEQIARHPGAEWTAASEGDPGRMLIEVFAYLTDQIIYRLNRLPAQVYAAFLRLLGVTLHPPSAAKVTLDFAPLLEESVPTAGGQEADRLEIEIPRGTRVTTQGAGSTGEAPVFVTLESLLLSPAQDNGAGDTGDGDASATGSLGRVQARHCTWVRREVLGEGTGQPGQSFQVAHPPIVAPFGQAFDVHVWVRPGAEADGRPNGLTDADAWQEVDRFSQDTRTRQVYTVDRLSGTIHFAPAVRLEKPGDDGIPILEDRPSLLAAVPGLNDQILVSYAYGGGASGNVLAGTLRLVQDPVLVKRWTVDQDPVITEEPAERWVTVDNLKAAGGGRDAETLDNALLRGPMALYAREQAVTARDYGQIVLESAEGRLARVRALAKRAHWTYAEPGTVEILMVPACPEPAPSGPERPPPKADLDNLAEWAGAIDLSPVHRALAESTALGTHHELKWAHYKRVQVVAELIKKRDVDTLRVEDRVRQRLEQYVRPFYDPSQPEASADLPGGAAGWPYGLALRVDEIEDWIERTEGVDRVRTLRLHVDAPDADVRCLALDPHRPGTWYTGSHACLYRSLNGGRGWEQLAEFSGEWIRAIRPNLDRDGLLALITSVDDPQSEVRAKLYISVDCGETWEMVEDLNYGVQDLDWLLRARRTVLLLATDEGLYEYELVYEQGRANKLDVPDLVPVDPGNPMAPISALKVLRGQRGQTHVAVALGRRGGVYVSDGADLVPSHLSWAETEREPARVEPPLHKRLSKREFRVLRRVAQGWTDHEIRQEELELLREEREGSEKQPERSEEERKRPKGELESPDPEIGTVVERILDELGLDNRAQVALYALRHRLVSLDGLSLSSMGSLFRRLSALDGHDVRHLAAQQEGPRTILWAAPMAEGKQEWGCYRWQLGQPEGRWLNAEWMGGSCRALTFEGTWVYAATQWGGVLKLDLSQGARARWEPSTRRDTGWEPSIPRSFLRFIPDQRPDYRPGYPPPSLETGAGALPGDGRVEQIYRSYKPLWAIAVDPNGTLMVAGDQGILRRVPWEDAGLPPDQAAQKSWDLYEQSSATEISRGEITLPYNGLFVSGEHQVRVINRDATDEGRGDGGKD